MSRLVAFPQGRLLWQGPHGLFNCFVDGKPRLEWKRGAAELEVGRRAYRG